MAFSRTRWSRVTTDMSCGGSPRDSTVADVYRIERAKGLYRKRASDAPEHVVGDRDDIAAPLEPPQRTNGGAFRVRRQSLATPCTHDRARRFRKCQCGRDPPTLGPQRFQCFCVVFEESGNERT